MILAVVNQKGGVGKTTCSYFLAQLASRERNVLVVDIDPQGDLTTSFTKQLPESSNIKLLWEKNEKTGGTRSDELVSYRMSDSLWLIGSDLSLSYWENPTSASVYFKLRGWLEDNPIDKSNWVIIDTPPNNGIFSTNALQVADFIVVPIDASDYALMGLDALFATVKQVNADFRKHNPLRVAGIVLSNVSTRLKFTKDIIHTLTTVHDGVYAPFVMDTVLPNSTYVKEAIAAKKDISKGPALLSYEKLYEELKVRTR